MLELGCRPNMTGMETKRAGGKCIANALVCQLCWTFLLTFKPPYLWNGARYGPSCYWPLIGICIRAFDWYQSRWPWMPLKGNNSLWYIMCLLSEAITKIWMKIHVVPNCQRRKCGAETLVCKDMRIMPIFVGVRWIWGIKWEWGRRKLPFLLLAVAISFQSSYMRPKLLCLSM